MLGQRTYNTEAMDIVNIEKDLAKVIKYCKPKPCNGDPEKIPCSPCSSSDLCQ